MKDMTVGNPLKLIIAFSIPLLIGNLFQQFYSIVDTMIVGRFLGTNALAAVGSTGTLFFMVTGLINGLTSGFSVLIAQKYGANEEEGIKKAVGNALMLSLMFSAGISVISVIGMKPLLSVMNTPANIINDAHTYITIICCGLIATAFSNMMSGILRAIGDSKTPLYFLIIATILNIILDIIFIIYFKMGVAGVGIATVIAQLVAGVLSLIYTFKKYPILKLTKHDFSLERAMVKNHLRIAIPMSITSPIIALGGMIVQSVLNTFGSNTIAAYTAAVKIENLVIQPGISLGITVATFVGQNLGAKNYERIKIGVKTGAWLSFFSTAILALISVVFGEFFLGFFINQSDTVVVEIAMHYLKVVGIFFIPLAIVILYANALQGMGQSVITMITSTGELVARSLFALLVTKYLGFTGVCLAGPAAWSSSMIVLIIIYFIKIKKLIQTEEKEVEMVSYQSCALSDV